MTSIRLVTFVFLLAVILQESAADIHQDKKKTQVAATNGFSTVKGGSTPSAAAKQDILDAVPTPQEATSTPKVWARKTMKLKVMMKQIVKEKDTITNEEVSKSSSAVKSNGKLCSKGKRKLHIECDINLRGNTHHHIKRQDLSSFVTLNADYHPPKSHPPKNN